MPVIQDSVSVGASATVDNVLAGSQWEFLPFDAQIDFGLNGDANGGDLRLDVFSGSDSLMENGQGNTANRTPVFPDDFTLQDVAAAGERLKIRVRNTNAGAARTLFFSVRIFPVS